ncbi:MAG: sigma-70 family RNA polymerase sigma factor [Acidobacteriota bacterium]|nr:sigma-70 family RNA polymerase sigma factor [Acidobacteriota bacterium]
MRKANDRALAGRAAAGQEAALAELYDRYADMLYAFVTQLIRDPRTEADDIWQETWLAAIRSLPAYDSRKSGFFTWLCGIARHKAADSRRSVARRPSEPLSSVSDDRSLSLMDRSPLPESVLESNAVRAAVIEALADLPPGYRRMLVARYADGASVREAAEMEGKSYKAAESCLERARRAFRRALNKKMGEAHAE